jgi:hypothetical protein
MAESARSSRSYRSTLSWPTDGDFEQISTQKFCVMLSMDLSQRDLDHGIFVNEKQSIATLSSVFGKGKVSK